jgi:hypothetical protein
MQPHRFFFWFFSSLLFGIFLIWGTQSFDDGTAAQLCWWLVLAQDGFVLLPDSEGVTKVLVLLLLSSASTAERQSVTSEVTDWTSLLHLLPWGCLLSLSCFEPAVTWGVHVDRHTAWVKTWALNVFPWGIRGWYTCAGHCSRTGWSGSWVLEGAWVGWLSSVGPVLRSPACSSMGALPGLELASSSNLFASKQPRKPSLFLPVFLGGIEAGRTKTFRGWLCGLRMTR